MLALPIHCVLSALLMLHDDEDTLLSQKLRCDTWLCHMFTSHNWYSTHSCWNYSKLWYGLDLWNLRTSLTGD